jgi:predicted dehydrogenase
MARMLLDLDAPQRVACGGGKYFYDDDRQTPDTQVVTFDFAQTCVVWEQVIWSRTGAEGLPWGVALYGDKGVLLVDDKGWHVTDGDTAGEKKADLERPHTRNFLDCIKDHKRPNADIEEGHKSTTLCHLGNLAYRVGRALRWDAKNETILGDPEANRLLGREYRKPFVVPERV